MFEPPPEFFQIGMGNYPRYRFEALCLLKKVLRAPGLWAVKISGILKLNFRLTQKIFMIGIDFWPCSSRSNTDCDAVSKRRIGIG